jgi:hypothetical protein
MSTTSAPKIVSKVKYLQWQKLYERERPFNVLIDILKDAVDPRWNNLVFEEKDTVFEDISTKPADFNLEDHDFYFQRHDHTFNAFEDQKTIEKQYLPEVERFIRQYVPDADRVHFFDWRASCKLTLFPDGLEHDILKLRNSHPPTIGSIIDLVKPTD